MPHILDDSYIDGLRKHNKIIYENESMKKNGTKHADTDLGRITNRKYKEKKSKPKLGDYNGS